MWCHGLLVKKFSLDIGSSVSITEAAKLVENEVQDKGLNLIINNAGVNIPGSLADTEKSTMVDVYTTNVVGPMIVAKVGAPLKTLFLFKALTLYLLYICKIQKT